MNIDYKKDMQDDTIHELCDAILLLKNKEEAYRFLKDLCTPQEMKALSERWRVCRLLDQRELSYRDINSKVGASLATIGRVARFLNDESYGGYQLVLERMHNKKDSIK